MVLDKIVDHKRLEVAEAKLRVPMAELEERIAQASPPRDFRAALRREGISLIAEIKRASPSRGLLIESFDHLALARTYRDAGAAAISVLTDVRFFQGSLKFMEAIRQLPDVPPILRKDFMLDPYQIYEARAYGADAILLIVGALGDHDLREARPHLPVGHDGAR